MSDVLQVSFKGSPIRKRKDPVIAFPFPVAGLQDVKHAYRFASKHKAWIRRGVVYDKHVDGSPSSALVDGTKRQSYG